MPTFFPGQTWCTLGGGGGPDGLPRKQDGIRDRSLPQGSSPGPPVMYSEARLIGLHVAEEEEPLEPWAWAWRS